ncbi:MAG: hypothetical protein WDN28_02955 [Chthoniobacter sp.]
MSVSTTGSGQQLLQVPTFQLLEKRCRTHGAVQITSLVPLRTSRGSSVRSKSRSHTTSRGWLKIP